MATFSSDLVTLSANRLPSAKVRDGDRATGKLTLATAIVTITSAADVADILALVPDNLLPYGACVVPQLSSVTCLTDPGTTLTIDVGDANNDDAYADGIVLSAGGQVAFTNTAIPSAVGTPVRIDETTGSIFATIKSQASLSATTVLVFTIAYRSK